MIGIRLLVYFMQLNNVKFIITHIYHVLIYSLLCTVVYWLEIEKCQLGPIVAQ